MNLLFVFGDQWRRDAIGSRGVEDVYTPNIDQFVRESMEFTNAISANPLSSPNRAAILTGKYPIKTGVWTNCKQGLSLELNKDENSIGKILKNNGYKTGYIGKWHLQEPDMNKSPNPISGAKDWDSFTPPGPYRQGFDFWYSYGADDSHLSPHYWQDSHEMIKINKWSVEHETDVALSFIKNNIKDKWALFLSWNPPHTPFDQVPEKYQKLYENKELRDRENLDCEYVRDHTNKVAFKLGKEKYREHKKNYYSAISGIDDNFKRLIEELKEKGVYDDTLIILTADHGEMLGSHGLWNKHVWYEESIGVPFILRLGNRYLGKNDTVINGVDIMPTILSILGIDIPKDIDGISIEKTMQGEKLYNYGIVSAYPGKVEAIKEFEKAGKSNLSYGWRGVRSKDYLYVVNKGYEPLEEEKEYFYNLTIDPYQLSPLKTGQEELEREKHRTILKEYLKDTKDPFEFN